MRSHSAVLVLFTTGVVIALDNGVGLLPPMGFNTYNRLVLLATLLHNTPKQPGGCIYLVQTFNASLSHRLSAFGDKPTLPITTKPYFLRGMFV